MPFLVDLASVIVGVIIAELALDVIRRARKRAHMRSLNRKSIEARRARAKSLTRNVAVPCGGECEHGKP